MVTWIDLGSGCSKENRIIYSGLQDPCKGHKNSKQQKRLIIEQIRTVMWPLGPGTATRNREWKE